MGAQNLELRQKLSGTFYNANSLVYVRSEIGLVDNLLDSNNKIRLELINSALLSTKKLVGTISGSKSFGDLLELMRVFFGDTVAYEHFDAYSGCYFIANGEVDITATSNHLIYYNDNNRLSATTTTINNGDHIFFVKLGSEYLISVTTSFVPDANTFHAGTEEELNNFVPTANGQKAILEDFDLLPISNPGTYNFTGSIEQENGEITKQMVYKWFAANEFQAYGDQLWSYNIRIEALSSGVGVGYVYYEISNNGNMDKIYYTSNLASNQYIWGIVNNTYDLATINSPGLMAAADKVKLATIADNANNYVHPSHTPISLDLTDEETANVITVDSQGHVTGFTKQTIRSATTALKGLIEIAVDTEMKTGTDTARAMTPALTKAAVKYFSGLTIYNNISTDLTTANNAHPDGALALFAV